MRRTTTLVGLSSFKDAVPNLPAHSKRGGQFLSASSSTNSLSKTNSEQSTLRLDSADLNFPSEVNVYVTDKEVAAEKALREKSIQSGDTEIPDYVIASVIRSRKLAANMKPYESVMEDTAIDAAEHKDVEKKDFLEEKLEHPGRMLKFKTFSDYRDKKDEDGLTSFGVYLNASHAQNRALIEHVADLPIEMLDPKESRVIDFASREEEKDHLWMKTKDKSAKSNVFDESRLQVLRATKLPRAELTDQLQIPIFRSNQSFQASSRLPGHLLRQKVNYLFQTRTVRA